MVITIKLGEVIISRTAASELNIDDVIKSLKRHETCDWGTASKKLKQANRMAVRFGKRRIISVYRDSNKRKFLIYTTRNRAITAIFLPYEYPALWDIS